MERNRSIGHIMKKEVNLTVENLTILEKFKRNTVSTSHAQHRSESYICKFLSI